MYRNVPIMPPISMGVVGSYGTEYGWRAWERCDSNGNANPTGHQMLCDERHISLNGTIKFYDDGGPDHNYSTPYSNHGTLRDEDYHITFDAGVGNDKIWVKVNSYDCSFSTLPQVGYREGI